MGSLTRFGLAVAALALAAAKPPPMPTPVASTTPSIRLGVEKWRAGAWGEAVAIWTPFAAAGEPDAQFNMGQAYKLGRGVTADTAVARDYYRKAAAKGHRPAQANLGISLFQTGDKPEAMRWLRLAADRGETRAQYVLGMAAYNGDGLPRNLGLGYAYLLRSAAGGLPQATTALARIEPSLGPNERQIGEQIAASLAAGTGVPATLAQLSSPGLINAAPPPGTTMLRTMPALPPPPLIKSPPPPAVPLSVVPRTVVPPAAAPRVVVPPSVVPPAVVPPAVMPPVAVPAAVGAAVVGPAVVGPPAGPPVAGAAPSPTAPVIVSTAPAANPAITRPVAKPAGWRVQLGAFSQRRLADEAWAAVQRGAKLDETVKPVFATEGEITKLQLGPYATREAARVACARLAETGRACFVTAG